MNRVVIRWVSVFVFLLSCSFSLFSQTLPTGFTISYVGSGTWSLPVGSVTNQDGTKLFVWEKQGKVFVCNWNNTTQQYDKQTTAVIDITEEVGNWRDHGLLGFALDPNFAVNGYIYLAYVVDRHHLLKFGTAQYNSNSNDYNEATIARVTRYQTTVSAGNLIAIPASRTILLGATKSTGIPILYESHGIGSLAFAADGTLLVSCGDASSYDTPDVGGNIGGGPPYSYWSRALTDGIITAKENVGSFRSQLIDCLNGKILRLDPLNGNGVSSNPFYDPAFPRAARSRVWAMGLRNPFRFCVRPNTGSTNPSTGDIGELYVSDVGWGEFEELTVIKTKGTNCGWPIYEGNSHQETYAAYPTQNLDMPNPLFGVNGCTQQYFYFSDLLKNPTYNNNTTIYNPCNPAIPIGSGIQYVHGFPLLDWKHGVDSSTVGLFINNVLSFPVLGTPASGVTGTAFRGNSAISGCWYTGTLFPPAYQNTFFLADYGAGWIKNLTIQGTDQLKKVTDFSPDFGPVVHMSENPLNGSIFCVDIGAQAIINIGYGGNRFPIVKMSASQTYGPGPMNVSFTGNLSYDPDGLPITYSWNFGDGSPLNTSANPSHSFSTGNGAPAKFVVKLTVKDNLNATSTDSIIISLNNTPPVVNITSPQDNTFYNIGTDTSYSLLATVSDNEHSASQLFYEWQTVLRHSNHEHAESVDTNKITETHISRIGCNGDIYYWFFTLKVHDAHGLKGMDSAKLFPYCGGPLPINLVSFNVTTQPLQNIISWIISDESMIQHYIPERSYDGSNFTAINQVNPAGTREYESVDANFIDGYVYYRLKIVNKDGSFAYSMIVRVYTGNKQGQGITVSPNPFREEFFLATTFLKPGKITIQLIDTKGGLVKLINKKVSTGLNSFTVDGLSTLPSGVYFLEINDGTAVKRIKVLKEN